VMTGSLGFFQFDGWACWILSCGRWRVGKVVGLAAEESAQFCTGEVVRVGS